MDKTYTENLLFSIFTERKGIVSINVITGYSSSTFLDKVLSILPEVRINVYIGMALSGITKKDHKRFVEICSDKDSKDKCILPGRKTFNPSKMLSTDFRRWS